MEKTYKKTIEVKKTVEIVIDEYNLGCLISNAMADNCGFEWWKFDKDAYKEAKDQLIAEMEPDADDQPSREDIMARMLFNGHKLQLLESESGWHWSDHEEGELLFSFQIKAEGCEPVSGTWHEVGLDDICRGLAKQMEAAGYPTVDRLVEDGDFWDADAVFQFAAYGELIFG